MNKFKVAGVAVVSIMLLVSVPSGFAQTGKVPDEIDSAKGEIGKNQFLSLLLNTHPLFAKENLNQDIAAEDVVAQSGGQDWTLEVNSQYARRQELNVQNEGINEINQGTLGASLGRQVWATGGFVSIGVDTGNGTFESGACPPGPDICNVIRSPDGTSDNQVSVTYSQPLLRNFGGKQSSMAFDVSKLSEKASASQVYEAKEQFLLSMTNEYIDWALLHEQQEINQRRFKLSRDQRKEMEKRYQKNLVEKVDLMRLQDSELNAKQQLLLTRSQLKAQTARLALLSQTSALSNKRPGFDLYQFPALPDLEETSVNLKANSKNIQLLDQNIAQLDRRLVALKDGARSELSLDLRAARKSENTHYATGAEEDDGQDYSVGLNFKKALGNHSAKSEAQKLQFEVDKLKLEKRSAQMDIEANLANLHIQLEAMADVLALNKILVGTAQVKTKEELKLYRQGRSDLTNVISSRDQTQGARLGYAQNAGNFHKLYAQLQALSDTLLSEVEGSN